MRAYSIEEIKSWDRFYRANFINCLTGFKPVSLIGTVSNNGVPNLSVVSSIVHLGADPAMVGYINRPKAAAPDTISNIEANGVFTINHIQESFLSAAHQCSAKYSAEKDEFKETGLTPIFEEGIIAPFVAESSVRYSMKLTEIVPVKHNSTFFVIGELTAVFLNESIVGEDGFLDLVKAGSLTSLGLDGYFSSSLVKRLDYAKP